MKDKDENQDFQEILGYLDTPPTKLELLNTSAEISNAPSLNDPVLMQASTMASLPDVK